MSVDLGAGADKLTLADGGNTATVCNLETLIGGSGADVIQFATAGLTNASVDLAAGSDTLTLGNFANSATVANVETLTGGSAATPSPSAPEAIRSPSPV